MNFGRPLAGLVLAAIALATAHGLVGPVRAEVYPTKPVRLIVGFPPGGATDLVARVIAPKLGETLKQQVIVDNRAGANGTIGAEVAAKAAPDGYTLHLGTLGALVISPAITKVHYDPTKDFSPIGQAVSLQNIFITHPSLPVRTLHDLIALAKKRPGALNYASSGLGSPGHLAGELFNTMAGVNIMHIPYKGGGPAITDLIAGHIEIFVAVISTAVPQVRAGKARALAVTGARRALALPEVPTVAEAGLKGYEASNWYGLVAPAGTPKTVIDRLSKELVAILDSPDVRDALLKRGVEAASSSPEQFAVYIKSETAKWGKVIKAANLQAK